MFISTSVTQYQTGGSRATLRKIPLEAVLGSAICTVSSRSVGMPVSARAKATDCKRENSGRDISASICNRAKSTRSSSWHSKRTVRMLSVHTCFRATRTHGQNIDAAWTNFRPKPKLAAKVMDSSFVSSSNPTTAVMYELVFPASGWISRLTYLASLSLPS